MQGLKKLTLLEILKDYVSDPRADREKKFPLEEILFLMFSMIVCGATSYADIIQYGQARLDWLRSYLPYDNGLPSQATLRRVLGMLDPEKVHDAFALWMRGAVEQLTGRSIAIDGKAMRGSKGADGRRTNIVSAVVDTSRLVLAQVACDKKSNEVTAIPELLEMLDLKGALVTIDAAGTQVQIANMITDKGGDWLLPVKGNRKNDVRAIDAQLDGCEERYPDPDGIHYAREEDNKHGRHVVRECWTEPVGNDFSGCRAFAGLKGIARIRTTRTEGDKTTVEHHRFIFSRKGMSAKQIIAEKRTHWASVENGLHYVLDVSFGEDASRVRKDHSAENFNALRHMAYNVLRQIPGAKGSFKSKQKDCLLYQDAFDRAIGIALNQ